MRPTKHRRSSITVFGLALAVLSIGCGGAETTDAGADGAASDPAAQESAACAHIIALDPAAACGTVVGPDQAACEAGFAETRTTRIPATCLPEYMTWLACIEALPACPTGGSILCPDEYTALGICSMM